MVPWALDDHKICCHHFIKINIVLIDFWDVSHFFSLFWFQPNTLLQVFSLKYFLGWNVTSSCFRHHADDHEASRQTGIERIRKYHNARPIKHKYYPLTHRRRATHRPGMDTMAKLILKYCPAIGPRVHFSTSDTRRAANKCVWFIAGSYSMRRLLMRNHVFTSVHTVTRQPSRIFSDLLSFRWISIIFLRIFYRKVWLVSAGSDLWIIIQCFDWAI